MELGTRLQLEFNDPNATRGVSSLIGEKEGEFVIIELPKEYDSFNKPDYLESGNSLIIRYISADGVIYGVKSYILRTIYTPVKLMIVDCPKVLENYNLRKDKRSTCLFYSEIEINNTVINGYILNISKTGCSLSIATDKLNKATLQKDTKVNLSINIPGMGEKLGVSAEVKNVTEQQDKSIYGLLFTEVNEKIQAMLTEVVKKLHNAI